MDLTIVMNPSMPLESESLPSGMRSKITRNISSITGKDENSSEARTISFMRGKATN